MLSSVEKKQIIFKALIIILISSIVISIFRVAFLHTELLEDTLLYTYVFKELFLSVFSIMFVAATLYIMMKKEIQKINNKVVNLAFTDGLTGLYNRHYLNNFLEKFSLLRKEDSNFAILFIDIDKFKEVNDSLGHSAGDCILKSLAEILKSLIRPKDILCRYGGEEFVIIISDISRKDAYKKADEIRSTIEDMHFQCKHDSITTSVGISFGDRDDDINRVMEEADSALYMAKNAGRNRVRVFVRQYEN